MKTANKYKPTNLGEVIYPSEAVRIRIQAYMSGNLEGNLLLWGPNGTGKTSVADLLPAYINNGDAHVDTNYEAILKKDDLNGYIANSCSIAEWGGHKKHFMVFHEFDNAKDDVNELWTAKHYWDTMLDRLDKKNETYLSTQQVGAQAPSRFSLAYGYCRWP